MTDHEHKFNASLVDWHGRCGCGSWGRYSRPDRAWKEVTNLTRIKNLNTQLSRLQNIDYVYPHAQKEAALKMEVRNSRDRQEEPEREYPGPRYFKDPGSI